MQTEMYTLRALRASTLSASAAFAALDEEGACRVCRVEGLVQGV